MEKKMVFGNTIIKMGSYFTNEIIKMEKDSG